MGIFISILLQMFLSGQLPGNSRIYPETAIVTELDYATDTVTVECFNGNLFSFYGTEDWAEGDICSMLMNDNGTPIVYDDEILSVKYSGYITKRK